MDTVRATSHHLAHPFAPTELYQRLGTHGYPLVIDVRKAQTFDADQHMLPGAVRVAPESIGQWDPTHARQVVAYCVQGHEVSQRAAAALRDRGFHATHLEGFDATEATGQLAALSVQLLSVVMASVLAVRELPSGRERRATSNV